MKGFYAPVKKFLLDESGQGTVEYILILSATVLGAATLGRAALRALDRGSLLIGGQLEKDLKTGRVPLSVWTN
jgi:Flp pilus assembly pilin Flp